MKICKCGSKDFSVTQQVSVKFLLDSNLNIIGHEMRTPTNVNGLIRCENCGKQYTLSSINELENSK